MYLIYDGHSTRKFATFEAAKAAASNVEVACIGYARGQMWKPNCALKTPEGWVDVQIDTRDEFDKFLNLNREITGSQPVKTGFYDLWKALTKPEQA